MIVNLDVQLTLMASSLYRLMALKIGNGYENAKSRHIFRDLIDANPNVVIGERDIAVRFQKRAHNPLLISACFDKTSIAVPWLGNKKLHIILG